MANGRNRNSKIDAGRDPGGFIAIPWSVMDCPAYAGLSHPAKALLLEVARQYVRDNNGKLLLSAVYLRKRGWFSADVIDRAKQQLLDSGLIFQTVMGHRPNKASWFAVTWRALDKLPGYDAGAEKMFVRGAYRLTQGKQKRAAPACKSPKKNAKLSPPNGTADVLLAPLNGIKAMAFVPADGAIKPVFEVTSVPSNGHHLEKPSAVLHNQRHHDWGFMYSITDISKTATDFQSKLH